MKRSNERRLRVADFRSAAEAIIERSDEIYATGIDEGKSLSSEFSDREIDRTNKICLAFMHAVAELEPEDLREETELIERLRESVLRADTLLAHRCHTNPQWIRLIEDLETEAFDLLRDGKSLIFSMARIGCRMKPLVNRGLMTAYAEIRSQLENHEGKMSPQQFGVASWLRRLGVRGLIALNRKILELSSSEQEEHRATEEKIADWFRASRKNQRKIIEITSSDDYTIKQVDGRKISKAQEKVLGLAVFVVAELGIDQLTKVSAKIFPVYEMMPGNQIKQKSFTGHLQREVNAFLEAKERAKADEKKN